MLNRKVADLEVGDAVRFRPEGTTYKVTKSRQGGLDSSLWSLTLQGLPDLTMPKTSELVVIEMHRPFTVPCVVCRKDYRLIHNVASGSKPRAVLCGACDADTTEEVMRSMREGK